MPALINHKRLFHRERQQDIFRLEGVPSPQRWGKRPDGQHIELGIAENNLFLMLAALGLAGPLFGERLLPVGTLYDPFIARGLDALTYASYQDARFLLVATPSGITLAPEGGAPYDRFRDRIMFPIRDRRGRTIAFGGRVIPGAGPAQDGKADAKYLNSPETPLFHKGRELYGLHEAQRANRTLEALIVVEGYLDVIALAQFDITNAVATLGTATTPEHLNQLFKLAPDIVRDATGKEPGAQPFLDYLERKFGALYGV